MCGEILKCFSKKGIMGKMAGSRAPNIEAKASEVMDWKDEPLSWSAQTICQASESAWHDTGLVQKDELIRTMASNKCFSLGLHSGIKLLFACDLHSLQGMKHLFLKTILVKVGFCCPKDGHFVIYSILLTSHVSI